MTDTTAVQDGVKEFAEATEKVVRSSVTKRDVSALVAAFETPAKPEQTAAEKERAKRIERLENGIRNLVKNFEEWGVTEGTPADAAAALKALQTVQKKATAAIGSLTEAKLGL